MFTCAPPTSTRPSTWARRGGALPQLAKALSGRVGEGGVKHSPSPQGIRKGGSGEMSSHTVTGGFPTIVSLILKDDFLPRPCGDFCDDLVLCCFET